MRVSALSWFTAELSILGALMRLMVFSVICFFPFSASVNLGTMITYWRSSASRLLVVIDDCGQRVDAEVGERI